MWSMRKQNGEDNSEKSCYDVGFESRLLFDWERKVKLEYIMQPFLAC